MPKVGVIMPTWNQGKHILAAVRSIVEQTFDDFVLLIYCDGPPDAGTEVALKFAAKHLGDQCVYAQDDENRGTAEALNLGHDALLRKFPDLKYLTWVSSDNEMRPEFLATLVDYLENHPEKSFVFSSYMRETGEHNGEEWSPIQRQLHKAPAYPRMHPKTGEPDKHQLVRSPNCFIGPAFLYRTTLWRAVGLHRGAISHDYDWWLRAEEVSRWSGGSIDVDLCQYRVHSERVTVTRRDTFDAIRWQAEAKARRMKGGASDSRRPDGHVEGAASSGGAVPRADAREEGASSEGDGGRVPGARPGEGAEPAAGGKKRSRRKSGRAKGAGAPGPGGSQGEDRGDGPKRGGSGEGSGGDA